MLTESQNHLGWKRSSGGPAAVSSSSINIQNPPEPRGLPQYLQLYTPILNYCWERKKKKVKNIFVGLTIKNLHRFCQVSHGSFLIITYQWAGLKLIPKDHKRKIFSLTKADNFKAVCNHNINLLQKIFSEINPLI